MFKWLENYVRRVALDAYLETIAPTVREEAATITENTIHDLMFSESRPTIKVQLDDGAHMPVRAHDTDAGADLFCIDGFVVPAHSSVEVGTGVHVQLPSWTKAQLVSKSGLNVKHCLQTEGLIDAGYAGEIRVRVYNHGEYDYEFEPGQKLTQLVITDVLYPSFEQVDSVVGGDRGVSGFGSTGI